MLSPSSNKGMRFPVRLCMVIVSPIVEEHLRIPIVGGHTFSTKITPQCCFGRDLLYYMGEVESYGIR